MRPIYLQTGVVSHASGSAYIESGNTKIICSVFGPREISGGKCAEFTIRGHIVCILRYAPFSYKGEQNKIQENEKEFSLLLQEALQPVVCLHTFPKARVDVFITVLENDGSVLSHALTSAGAALIDAGIALYGIVVGCSLIQHGDVSFVDPTRREEEEDDDDSKEVGKLQRAMVVMGYMPAHQQVVALQQYGKISAKNFAKAASLLQQKCCMIYNTVEKILNCIKD